MTIITNKWYYILVKSPIVDCTLAILVMFSPFSWNRGSRINSILQIIFLLLLSQRDQYRFLYGKISSRLLYITTTIVPGMSGHLRFEAKVAPRGRWPPDTGTKTVVGTLQKWPTKADGHPPEGPAVAGTTVLASRANV